MDELTAPVLKTRCPSGHTVRVSLAYDYSLNGSDIRYWCQLCERDYKFSPPAPAPLFDQEPV